MRTKTVKKAARLVIEKYYPRLTLDFQCNKRLVAEVAVIPSKRMRNKIAGYTTHLMKRIEKGPVRGISFKLQEEERERKDNYVPEVSVVDTARIEVDAETKQMLAAMGFGNMECASSSSSLSPLVLLLTRVQQRGGGPARQRVQQPRRLQPRPRQPQVKRLAAFGQYMAVCSCSNDLLFSPPPTAHVLPASLP